MWCNILFLFIFGNIMIPTIAVNMCTNGSAASSDLSLNLLKGSGSSDCYCSIIFKDVDKLPGNVQSTITFEAEHFAGCKYKLVVSYNKTTSMLSCNNTNTLFHTINKTDKIQLYLELNFLTEDDTEFEVKITSGDNTGRGPMIKLECLSPNTADNTAIPSSNRTNTMKTSTPSTITMESTENIATSDMANSLPPPIISTENIATTVMPSHLGDSIPDLVTSISIFETTHTSTYDSTNSNEEMEAGKYDTGEDDNDDVVTAGIIGGVIGCVIGGVIVGLLIFTIKRIVEHRKKISTSEMYSSPLSQRQPESHYTDLQLS